MQAEIEHQQESSNNINHLRYQSSYLIRQRRKIYDDNDFREVVKNFYNLVSEINKVKKISKAPPIRKQPQQLKQRNTNKNKQPNKELSHLKREINSEPDQQAKQYFNSCFSQKIISQLMPNFDCPSSGKQVPFLYDKPKPHLFFKRNQIHIQTAYNIYIKKFDSRFIESQDPTSIARKVMNSNFNSKTQYQEEEKEGDLSDKLNKSYQDGKKKPLKELVREFQSDQ